MRPRTAFISGPLDASPAYFTQHYQPAIDTAIASNHSFVIGPVRGIDTLALDYLLSQGVATSRITIHMAEFEYNQQQQPDSAKKRICQERGIRVHVEGQTTRERDGVMTRRSDYDILRYRTEGECRALYGEGWWPRVSNTEMNERRRRGDASQAYVRHGSIGDGGDGDDEESGGGVSLPLALTGGASQEAEAGRARSSPMRSIRSFFSAKMGKRSPL